MIVRIVETFLSGPLSIIVIIFAFLLGGMALFMTPREEEPQIVVPMVDVSVSYPGHSPQEVEQQVTVPLERLLWQIDGVEHVYSVSRRDGAMATARFYVGQDRDRSMVKVRDKIDENLHIVPPGVTGWQVDSVEIDDVPIVTLTIFSPERSPYELRRIAEEMKSRMDAQPSISMTDIFGAYPREILVEPRLQDMAGRNVSLPELEAALTRQARLGNAGHMRRENRRLRLLVAPGVESAEDVRNVVVRANQNGIIRVDDIADVVDGPAEAENYVSIGFGPQSGINDELKNSRFPAVTLSFSKKRGTNAVKIARDIILAAEELRGHVLPPDVHMLVTRNYGETANRKVNDLVTGMIFAIVTVVGLITLAMGWREGLVVGMAVPVSFALALFVNYIAGFTINRVTLFALILSLGLVVDDPITNVDNIQRHILMGIRRPYMATLYAVHEVIPPVIMSTLAIIISFTPMFFITGMMGPYMGPMAINVPLTVTFSTFCALTFVPWLSYQLLKKQSGKKRNLDSTIDNDEAATPLWVRKLYRGLIAPLLSRRNAIIVLVVVFLLTLGSAALMVFKVPLKMLPFDNKDELQLILKMPEGSSLEQTAALIGEFENDLAGIREVKNFQSYIGINAPIDFNGLVRHYGLRREPHQADIRINLAGKDRRKQQSHSIALRIHDRLMAIAERHNAVLNLVEVPPGPPVLSTLAVELRGRPDQPYSELISGSEELKRIMRETDGRHIVQLDSSAETPHERLVFLVNRDKAAVHGLSVAEITRTVQIAVSGSDAGTVHDRKERNPLVINVRLPFADRNVPERLGQLWIRANTQQGEMVQLSELGRFVRETEEQPIYHKNLERVVFVYGECMGRPPGEIILEILTKSWNSPVSEGFNSAMSGQWRQRLNNGTSAEWGGEGEWQITVRVFRDLGIAFAVAMLGIFLLLIVQTRSLFMPFIIMCAIPLTIIGIAPGFYLLNLLAGREVGGYADPVFFTATGMIG
ncbi:MAG: efflux RND transporter permease subunit, partial [Victivallales bacterium]|nr:efflux RND transporter permease subunit [Victivallales bacterium]